MKNKTNKMNRQELPLKIEAISRWKSGESISRIANDLSVTRATLYRWIKSTKNHFSKSSPRKRRTLDSHSISRVLEAFILCGSPSIRKLSEILEDLYAIRLSESKLRRLIKKLGFDVFVPSSIFESLILKRADEIRRLRTSGDKWSAGEIDSK